MLSIRSKIHDYNVEEFATFAAAIGAAADGGGLTAYLVDERLRDLYGAEIDAHLARNRTIGVTATEEQKAFENLSPLFLDLLASGFRRDGRLVVIGGGVLQDIGCFMASVLFRGISWDLVPTTLLAQADSCIGSKSSINIGRYKNQIGTFYPPHRILLSSAVLATLPWDEVRSGLGEVIKLQLLAGDAPFRELMEDLEEFKAEAEVLSKWVGRSLAVKKEYIERDEFDRGPRNLLNYGHTFGHAYESASDYAIPHGIAVLLGIVTATYVSAQRGLVSHDHYQYLRRLLVRWFQPFDRLLKEIPRHAIFQAISHDKKNTAGVVNCILTRGPGAMEKAPVPLETDLIPTLNNFLDEELT